MTNPIDKVFGSRELIEYVEEIKEEVLNKYNELIDEINEEHSEDDTWIELENKYDYNELDTVGLNWMHDIDSDFFYDLGFTDVEDLENLINFYDELSNYGDFKYGETIIRDDYWVEYCEQLCEEIGDIPEDLPRYIANHIDWKGVAEEIAMDYTYVTYDGEDYYIRIHCRTAFGSSRIARARIYKIWME